MSKWIKKCKNGNKEKSGQAVAVLNNGECIVLAGHSNNFSYWTPIMKNDSVDGAQIITT